MHAGLQAFHGTGRGEAEVEHDLETAGHDIAGAGAGVGVGNLEAGGREIVVAGVPGGRREFGQRRRGEMHGILHQMRIGDVALHALDAQRGRERTAAAVLHGVAEAVDAGRLADDAEVDDFVARLERFDHAHRAVDGVAFLVGGQQQRQRVGADATARNQAFHGDDGGGDRAFHVGRAATVEPAVAHGRLERRRGPLFQRAGGHYVGVAGKADQAAAGLATRVASRPEVRDAAGIDAFDVKAEPDQPGGDQVEAAGIVGRYRRARDQRPGFFQDRHQASMFSLKSLNDPGATDLV